MSNNSKPPTSHFQSAPGANVASKLPEPETQDTVVRKLGIDLKEGDIVLIGQQHLYRVAETCEPTEDQRHYPTKGILKVVDGVSRSMQSIIQFWSNTEYTVVNEADINAIKIQNKLLNKGNPMSQITKGMSTTGTIPETMPTRVETVPPKSEQSSSNSALNKALANTVTKPPTKG